MTGNYRVFGYLSGIWQGNGQADGTEDGWVRKQAKTAAEDGLAARGARNFLEVKAKVN